MVTGNKASQLTTEQVQQEAIMHLRNMVPWLLMRMGDGEALAFDSEGHDVITETENIPWRKHLGQLPTDEEKREWCHLTETSMRCVDVMGLHPSDSTQGKQFARSGRAIREDRGHLYEVECSANVHLDLMRENKYQDIIKQARGVYLVSGHDIRKDFHKEFFSDKSPDLVKHVQTPLQSCYFEVKTAWSWWTHEFLTTVKALPRMPGWLVLVGTGIPGKAVMWALKERGGVVLDIGSVFDKWAGYATRGRGKGVWKRCPVYKIGASQDASEGN